MLGRTKDGNDSTPSKIFLSLYSEQRTAHIVAKYLYDPSASALCDPNDSPINAPQVQLEEYDSPMHKRTINLPRFKAFLEENCVRREQIRANIHVRPHRVTIEVLATTNQDIWSNTAPPLLTAFRENYCQKYAALPSNTHRAESTIKDANHSQIKCREEVLCSTYATARSGIVENLNTSCNKALQERTNIKGNHTVTGGVFGGRKRKYDGSAGSVVKKKKWEDLKINRIGPTHGGCSHRSVTISKVAERERLGTSANGASLPWTFR
jgi:hypothetical protein